MTKSTKAENEIPIDQDDRIDEFAKEMLKAMGHVSLSDTTVLIYTELKRRKDKVQPGRLKPEDFAMVSVLGDILDRKLGKEQEEGK